MLEKWRAIFNAGEPVCELPNGYENKGVVTNVAVAGDKRTLGSLTGTMVITLDPFLKNPTASPIEILQALFALTRATEVDGMRAGAQEAYIAIPNDLPDYQALVEKCGFMETAQNCKIYRHQFFPPEPEEKVAENK